MGRRSRMMQMYNNTDDGNNITTMQRLQSFRTISSASGVFMFMVIQSIQSLNKEVEMYMLAKEQPRPNSPHWAKNV